MKKISPVFVNFQKVYSTGTQGCSENILKDFVISTSDVIPGQAASKAPPSTICFAFAPDITAPLPAHTAGVQAFLLPHGEEGP